MPKKRAAHAIDRALDIKRLIRDGGPAAVQTIVARARDRSAEVRARAVEALGQFPESDLQHLIAALSDRHDLVRIQAIESIVVRQEGRALRDLRRALADPSDLVRSYAAAAIGALGRRTDRSLLRTRLAKERSAAAQLGFLEGLWLLKDRAVLDDALRLLGSDDHRVRCATAAAMAGTFLSPRTRGRIEAALTSRLAPEKAVSVREALERALATTRSAPDPARHGA